MLLRNFLIFSLVLLKFHNYSGCDDSSKKNESSPKQVLTTKAEVETEDYDLSQPRKIGLVKELDEISGIAYYPKDSSIFAIAAENGSLFKILLNKNNKTIYWHVDKKHDFEDIVLHDSIFYILISTGDIEILKFRKDSLSMKVTTFMDKGTRVNEFETLYFDDHYGKLVLLCKNCEADKNTKFQTISSFGISADSLTWSAGLFKIPVKQLEAKLKIDELHLKPSAAAINPITKDLYILASENRLLVTLDKNRDLKNVYLLDPALFNQPGGLAFTPSGDLLISNEAGESGTANILIFKYQKKE